LSRGHFVQFSIWVFNRVLYHRDNPKFWRVLVRFVRRFIR